MNWADALNATLEVLGGFFIIFSIIKLRRDKLVRGVHWSTVSFFMLWGYWNMYYYPSLGQWLSFAGGVFMEALNTWWVFLIVYYTRLERSQVAGDAFVGADRDEVDPFHD